MCEVSETAGPIAPPVNAPTWPNALLLDGSPERADRFIVAEPSSRLLCVANMPDGHYEVVNDLTRQGVRVTWDIAALPHLWLRCVLRVVAGANRRRSSVSNPHRFLTHSDSSGLERTRAEGQAVVLHRGERYSSWIRVTPFREA